MGKPEEVSKGGRKEWRHTHAQKDAPRGTGATNRQPKRYSGAHAGHFPCRQLFAGAALLLEICFAYLGTGDVESTLAAGHGASQQRPLGRQAVAARRRLLALLDRHPSAGLARSVMGGAAKALLVDGRGQPGLDVLRAHMLRDVHERSCYGRITQQRAQEACPAHLGRRLGPFDLLSASECRGIISGLHQRQAKAAK